MNPYLQLIRPSVSLLGAFGALVGALVAGFYDPFFIIIALLVTFFVSGAGNTINDYFDYKIDKVNRPKRPIPSGKIKRSNALVYAGILYALGIVLCAFLNIYCLILALFNVFITIAYSWKLKRTLFIGNIIPSWLGASAFLFGSLLTGAITIPIMVIALMAFLSNTGREIAKDIEDIKGDRREKSRTLPIAFNMKVSKAATILLVLIAIAITPIPYLLGLLGLYYMYIVLVCDAVLVYSCFVLVKNVGKAQKLMKIAMFIGILAFLVGTI